MEEFIDVYIYDLELNVQLPRKPKSVGRVIERSINTKTEQRAYSTDIKQIEGSKDTVRVIFHNPEIERAHALAKKQGKKLRIRMPEGGAPVFLGKDAIEFLKAHRPNELTAFLQSSSR
ncbi:MAG: hypothetical protein WC045_03255 [Patescibacteria group bacterium]